ncbi:hypothetical protein G7Y89_g9754 [Cudoniella acicularis]|uniref:Uncharacterized protein n=1 Tax=Cudoniella acicularis TaxID=354080 RepID=A0A8H4W299_9HELO|nr:hypothetical protein G7Y89_g9754 [Cudoniella acicularis]
MAPKLNIIVIGAGIAGLSTAISLQRNVKQSTEDMPMAKRWAISRSGLVKILAQAAEDRGVKIVFDSEVDEIDSEKPPVHLKNGKTMGADLIVGADVICSVCRTLLCGSVINGDKSGMTTYNVGVPRSLVDANLDLLIFTNTVNFWLGCNKFVGAINMRDNKDNLGVSFGVREETETEGDCFVLGDTEGIKKLFANFDPILHRLLDLSDPESSFI